MKFYKLFLLLPLLFVACNKEEPKYIACEHQAKNSLLQVYNDLLIELVEQHFYNLYLGEEQEALLQDWYKIESPDLTDFARFDKRLINLQNKLFGDSARFKTIYIAKQVRSAQRFDELLPDGLEDLPVSTNSLEEFLRKYDADLRSAVQQLSKTKEGLETSNFRACTFKADALGDAKSWLELPAVKKQQAIGQVAFSEIYWINRNKGLMYYEFTCGTKCGKGELLSFKNVNGRWKILDKYQLWIS